jgi:hypothetical protein
MGRTVLTFRQLIEEAAAHWSRFRHTLRREDQQHFDRLFRIVRSYTYAATYECHDNPMEAILLSIVLDQEKRLAQYGLRLEAIERALRQAGVFHALTGMDSRSRDNNQDASDGQKRAVRTPSASLRAALGTNLLRRGSQEH